MSLKGFNGTWNCGKHEIFSLIRRRTKRGLIYRRSRISCQCQTVMVGHRCCWPHAVIRFPCIQVYAKWAWWIITFLQVEAPKKLLHRRDSWQLLQYASLIPLEIWFRRSNLIFSLFLMKNSTTLEDCFRNCFCWIQQGNQWTRIVWRSQLVFTIFHYLQRELSFQPTRTRRETFVGTTLTKKKSFLLFL